jgi:hypothetical protein
MSAGETRRRDPSAARLRSYVTFALQIQPNSSCADRHLLGSA